MTRKEKRDLRKFAETITTHRIVITSHFLGINNKTWQITNMPYKTAMEIIEAEKGL